jgi:hypothetical protein
MKLSDLQVVVQIIDLAAEKGIFKGVDLKTVGEVRERIIDFVKANAQSVEGTPTPEGATNESSGTETK